MKSKKAKMLKEKYRALRRRYTDFAEAARLELDALDKSSRTAEELNDEIESKNARQAATIVNMGAVIDNQEETIAKQAASIAKLNAEINKLRTFDLQKSKRIVELEKENAELRGQLTQCLAVFALPEYSDPKTIGKFTTITVRGNDGSYTTDVIRDGYEGQRER